MYIKNEKKIKPIYEESELIKLRPFLPSFANEKKTHENVNTHIYGITLHAKQTNKKVDLTY